MADINDVADYLIVQLSEAGETPSAHRLHKLLYYVQGWHLALHGCPIFAERFEAWVHGPICRRLFDRFYGDRSLYGVVEPSDVRPGFSFDVLTLADREHIDRVLSDYAIYPTFQLMWMSRQERPWINARGTLALADRCERELSDEDMRDFFLEEMGAKREQQIVAAQP